MHRIHAIVHDICDAYWDRHMGALDEHGRPGYVPDPTYLRRHPPKMNISDDVCSIALGKGNEGPDGGTGLLKIRVDEPSLTRTKKVLCMVYTYEHRHSHVRAIAETWGPKCDGFVAASNKTDPSIGAVNILHEGPEAYHNMWMKVVAMYKYAYKHFIHDYDFFHFGGDDMYVIPENLRHTISTGNWKGPWNESQPLMLGGSYGISRRLRFCGGGAGYTLNTVALRLLVEKLMSKVDCRPHWQGSDEDILIAKCFFYTTGLQCLDTNDEKMEARYHPYSVDRHASWHKKRPLLNWKLLASPFHNITMKERLGQISERSVSFHLKTESGVDQQLSMRRLHAILYRLCPENSTLNISAETPQSILTPT